jgi:hypothetical protein
MRGSAMKKIILLILGMIFIGCSSTDEKDDSYNDYYGGSGYGFYYDYWDDDDYCDYYHGDIDWDDLSDDEREQIKDEIREELINTPEFREKFEDEYRTNPEFREKVNERIEEKYDVQLPDPRATIDKDKLKELDRNKIKRDRAKMESRERINRERIQRERIQRERIQRERIQRERISRDRINRLRK